MRERKEERERDREREKKHGVNKKGVDYGMINITEKFEPCSNSIYREIDKL